MPAFPPPSNRRSASRSAWRPLSGVIAGLILLLFLVFISELFSGLGSGVLHTTPEEKRGFAAAARGSHCEAEGRLQEALAEYHFAAFSIPHGVCTPDLDRLYRSLGQYDEALRAIDEGLAETGGGGELVVLRAHCLAEARALDHALAYLEQEDHSIETPGFEVSYAAWFHQDRGEWCEALPLLHADLEKLTARLHYKFTEEGELDPERIDGQNHDFEGVMLLNDLARCSLRSGDDEAALHYGNMAVSVEQYYVEKDRSWFSNAATDTGSCEARLIRTEAFLNLGQLEAAREELLHAERSGTSYSEWLEEIERLRAELASAP